MNKRWMGRVAVGAAGLLSTASLAVWSGPSALAAVPGNDTIAQATVVTALPFTEQVDTTKATTDAQDAQVNASCGAPATDHSVWYSYTPSADGGIVVDVSRSSYQAGVIIATGTPGDLSTWACGPYTVGAPVYAGRTYFILAFADTPGDPGGTLEFSMDVAPSVPTMQVTVDRYGTVSARTGSATISGTYTCTDADYVEIWGTLKQSVGRFAVTGWFDAYPDVVCDGSAQHWSTTVSPDNGRFAGGKAASLTYGTACNIVWCSDWSSEQTIQLRGGHR